MLRSRITPCLLVHKKGLVKTVEFDNPKYLRKAQAKLKFTQSKYSVHKGKRTKHRKHRKGGNPNWVWGCYSGGKKKSSKRKHKTTKTLNIFRQKLLSKN
jgi:hypothetical protein